MGRTVVEKTSSFTIWNYFVLPGDSIFFRVNSHLSVAMSEHNVVQLSLDKEDHFFQNIERSRLAAGLSVRRKRASQVSITNQAWLGNDAVSTQESNANDSSRVCTVFL